MDKKLTRSEIEQIAKNYSLGSVRKATPMNKGWVNYSYDVSTDTGNYIVQIIGDPYQKWKQKRMRMQFALLNHLKRKEFPYEIPAPIINSNQQYISHLNKDRHLWVYKKIDGETVNKL